MAGMTEQARAHSGRPDGRCRHDTAARAARTVRGFGLSLLAIALLAASVLSATASARVNGAPLRPAGAAALRAAETFKAPEVTAQPQSLTVEEGQSASFTAAASGFPAPTVQWERSTNGGSGWRQIAGATSATLTIAVATSAESGYQFRAVFTNVFGKATTQVATLMVHKVPPTVTRQPASVTVEEGRSAVFEATASGYPAPTVQWQTSPNAGLTWSNVAGGTSTRLTVAGATTSISGQEYRAVFKNISGTATSEPATLTVQKLPAVSKQPVSLTVDEGQSAVFEATASGFPAPTVQWEVSVDGSTWQQVTGATSDQLTIPDTSVTEDGHRYRAVFQNAAGSVTSAVVTLTVHAVPVVTLQPASTTVEVGEEASFEAAASGYPAPTVRWELSTNAGGSWSALPGATSLRLTIANPQVSESGYEYRAAFTNAAGTATSAAARLTVATTHYHALAWGENLFGQLGDGAFSASSNVPTQVVGLKFVVAVSAGGHHSLALLADGTVVAWGDNEFGQLGDGTTERSNVPVAVTGLSGVKAIAAGGQHSLALLSNGTVMAWGDNEGGQLGDGSTTGSEVPVAVTGLTGVKAISAGGGHSLALLSNGTVMAWGENEAGQLGDGGTKSRSAPVAVKGLSGVAAISAGGDFSLALLTNGTVESWGSDERGQLDHSASEEGGSNVPVPAEGLTGVAAVAAGAEHSLALLSTGSVMAWGADSAGQLGNGVIKGSQEAPVAVSGLSGVTAISAGGRDSAALLGSGSIMAWGSNAWGTLGEGLSGGSSDVPVVVSGPREATSVSVGGAHMLAFGELFPTVTGVSPSLGPAAGGARVTVTGAGFTGATAVRFGAAEATEVTVNSSSSVTATAPAGTGAVDVTIVTPAGTSLVNHADRYTYQQPPAISKLSVKTGPATGGTSVTITGSQFTGATKVTFGGVEATSVTVNSDSSITVLAPAVATAGTVDVVVTNTAGSSPISSKDHFKYLPVIESLTPASGSTAGGETITVTGAGFAPGTTATSLKFGSVKAKSVNCASAASCTVVVPAGAAGTVTVTAAANKATSTGNAPGDQFSYS
jgi:alpha-tubulin suppressor-like RCC1 family protein